MRLVLTNGQMREADAYTIQKLGVPSLTLMERAGEALANATEMLVNRGRILCVCGSGNNGGDGFVCARILKARGRTVDCLSVGDKESDERKINREKWELVGGKTYFEFPKKEKYSLIVDCLFGTGFHGACSFESLIEEIKNSGARVLACDIPSGVNGDSGKVQTCAVKADATLCIGEVKAGVYLGDGIDYAGKILRADIGISLPQNVECYARVLECEDIARLVSPRKRNTHKGSYKKAAIVAGSYQYSGAAYLSSAACLATAACLRSGAGYTALYLPKSLIPAFMLKLPEALLKETNEGDRYEFNEESMRELLDYEAVAFGMGMGNTSEVKLGAKWLLQNYQGKLILDADALNALSDINKSELKTLFVNKKCDVVITPHIKEFSRLTGEDVETLLNQGLDVPKMFAKSHKTTVLLKNAVTTIASESTTAINVRGTAGQAKGGSGDVLSGVIAGLCAQGLSAFDGACAGAYLTGRAAELACEKIDEYALLPSDVISYLGGAFLTLRIPENTDKDSGAQ